MAHQIFIWSGPARQFSNLSILSIFAQISLVKTWTSLSLSYSVTKVHCDKPSTYKVKCLRNQKNARHTLLCTLFEHDVITGRVTVYGSLSRFYSHCCIHGYKVLRVPTWANPLRLVWLDNRIGYRFRSVDFRSVYASSYVSVSRDGPNSVRGYIVRLVIWTSQKGFSLNPFNNNSVKILRISRYTSK